MTVVPRIPRLIFLGGGSLLEHKRRKKTRGTLLAIVFIGGKTGQTEAGGMFQNS